MSDPFLAEIRIFAGSFAPRGWATCDGQILPIAQNTALFSLLGTTYGGNGQTTFALPNLQGATPLHPGQGPGLTPREPGESGGEPAVSLLGSQVASHNHGAQATTAKATAVAAQGGVWAAAGPAVCLAVVRRTRLASWRQRRQSGDTFVSAESGI